MKVLFFYPNLYGMNTLPPALGTFTAILKRAGYEVALFDTTNYEGLFDSIDGDKEKSENLNAREFDDTILKKGIKNSNLFDDFENVILDFKPDLIAMSVTEDTFPVGVNLLIGASGGKITIGNNCAIAPNCVLRASNHTFSRVDIPIREQGHTYGEIIIEDDVWIASNCVITANTKIKRGSIVAAGSVVTKDVEEFSIVGGVPAKLIRKRE